jgi:putative transposase
LISQGFTAGVCIIHLTRGTFRYASKRYWEQIAKDLRPIYTAPTAAGAWAAFEELEEEWATPYPSIGQPPPEPSD